MKDACTRLTGVELQQRREALGLTRAQVCRRLPETVAVQTLSSYELGFRAMTVGRLLVLCRVLGISAATVHTG